MSLTIKENSNSKNTSNLLKKLDFMITNQEDRIKLVKEILNDKEIAYNNCHPSKTDCLSHDNLECRILEKMANYILFSNNAERITKKTNYNFYTSDKFEKRLKKEKNLTDIHCEINSFDASITTSEDTIDFLVKSDINYKRNIPQSISNKDLLDETLKSVAEYQNSINVMKMKLDNLRKEKKNIDLQKKLCSHMKMSKRDQVYLKDLIKGTIYFKSALCYSNGTDYEEFDFFNNEHVFALLRFPHINMSTDLGLLVNDLEKLISECNFTRTESQILKLYRIQNANQVDISKTLGVSQQYIYASLISICKKIIDRYENRYEDWYYLNIVRGKFKKCSKCGEIKLANERYFSINKNSPDNLNTICKKCRSKRACAK